MPESYIKLALGSYVINHANGIKRVRNKYDWKLRRNYVTKITLELRQKVTLDLRQDTT